MLCLGFAVLGDWAMNFRLREVEEVDGRGDRFWT